MRGLMMDFPLTLTTIFNRAEHLFEKVEIVSRRPDGTIGRRTFGEFHRRARKLAHALRDAGIQRGDRVATLMWNHEAQLEAYFGIPLIGAVLHTLNLRLHPNEIAFIANHAADRFLIVDDALLPIYEKFKNQVKFERVIVVPFCGGPLPAGVENYEDFIAGASGEFEEPQLHENEAAAMCFTSGTTGNPKGVLYSHRSLVLHSFAQAMVDGCGIGHHSSVLMVTPMFHANGWGLPFAAVMTGAKLVLPGPMLDPESILDLIEREEITISCGVPTVWMGALAALDKNPGRWKFRHDVELICGGSAPPESMIRGLDRHGFHLRHLWGMTETTPVATLGGVKSDIRDASDDEKYRVRSKQGWPAPFIELRVMTEKGIAPWDGNAYGELEVRGPWVASSYYEAPETRQRWTDDGWFKTGDIATIDADGYLRILDRTKDMIKSGGEWISSVDLENALMGHPGVREAAVIGLPHPKWQERPLAVVVLKAGDETSAQDLTQYLATKFAKWQLPDAIVFAEEIPRTSVGKFLKLKLREQYANWKWE